MCGDPHTRVPTVDSGDLIAIIHATQTFSGGRLIFSNRLPGATRSVLEYNPGVTGWESDSDTSSDGGVELGMKEPVGVRIHTYGQPLNHNTSNPVIHSFFVDTRNSVTAGARLNLSVGADGLVGRTVSIVDEKSKVLGEGVIGWG